MPLDTCYNRRSGFFLPDYPVWFTRVSRVTPHDTANTAHLDPEQRELERKRAELEALQYELAHRELELTTLQATLEDFERRYLRIVGAKLARLDELDVRIANVLTLLNPQDPATARGRPRPRHKPKTQRRRGAAAKKAPNRRANPSSQGRI